MFQPNLIGHLQTRSGRNIHGQAVLGPARECPFAIVNLESRAQKTSVRADSSGSRGSADEIASDRLKILVPAYVVIGIDDQFTFEDGKYTVRMKHPRRSVYGNMDHFECDLEVMP